MGRWPLGAQTRRRIGFSPMRCSSVAQTSTGLSGCSAASSATTSASFFLDWQNQLSKLVLEVTQVGFGIAAEAGPQSSAVASAFKVAAKPTPALPVARRQIAGLDR